MLGVTTFPYPNGGLVAVDTGDGQPGGQVQHVLQNLLVQLQVGKLPFPLERAQVDLVRGEVLGESGRRHKVNKLRHVCSLSVSVAALM